MSVRHEPNGGERIGSSFSRSVTVLHLIGALDPGGAETRLLELLRRRAGIEQHIFVALSGRGGALDAEFEALGHIVVPRRLSLAFPLWFIRFLRGAGVTHVHSHVHLASGYLLLLAVAAGVRRRIAHFWSTGDGRRSDWSRQAYRRLGRFLVLRAATDVVMVSRSVAASVLPRSPDRPERSKVRVVYSRIDGSRFVASSGAWQSGNAPRLIAVGRLDQEKNPVRALEVLAKLRERRAEASLALAGRYSPLEREALDRRIHSLGLAGAVSLLGQRDDVPDLMAQSDLLLSTTVREGLPGAIVEAAAAGVPAVVSAIAPNEEVAMLLPSIIPVPLAASDEAWCDVIEGVLDARVDRFRPETVRYWFDRSPFSLTDSSPEIDALWT